MVAAGADESVILIYTRTISDLEEDRTTSINYERYMSDRIRMTEERDRAYRKSTLMMIMVVVIV